MAPAWARTVTALQKRELDAQFQVSVRIAFRSETMEDQRDEQGRDHSIDPGQLVEATRRAMERLDRLVRRRTLQAIRGARQAR
jgi:hypothetical protein